MAIGLGKMFGFTFQENFQYPYTARSVTDFWHRWHISLSSWFRVYVYIPLGGNRVKTWKHVRNILIVWMLTGLWHGANWNFVIWGLYYGILLLAEKYLLQPVMKKIPVWVTRVGTFLLVMVGWVFFSHTDLSAGLSYLGNLVGIQSAGFADLTAFSLIRSYGILLVIGAIVCNPLPMKKIREMETVRPLGVAAVSTGLFVLCTAYLVYNSYNPFLYFRF